MDNGEAKEERRSRATINRAATKAERIVRVLGIDPGSQVTGYGLVEEVSSGLRCVTFGEIKPARGAVLSTCLRTVRGGIEEAIHRTKAEALSIENIFYGKNVRSLIKQGHVRGVAILAAAESGIPVYEYSPLEIKKAVVGYGRAEKGQVQMMVRAILKLSELPPPDAADALAVAICHLHFKKVDPT